MIQTRTISMFNEFNHPMITTFLCACPIFRSLYENSNKIITTSFHETFITNVYPNTINCILFNKSIHCMYKKNVF